MGELIDIYDENMHHIGVKDRGTVHAEGLWHRTFHCWIVARRDDRDVVLFQLRGPQKSVYPNTLDITAAGHLEAGESAQQGIRELDEELGVRVAFESLSYLGIRCDVAIIGDVINREFCDTYLIRDDRALAGYTLQEDEVAGLAEISIADGLRLFSGEVDQIAAATISLHGDPGIQRRSLTIHDVIPRTDRYYLKVCIMAQRLLAGDSYLAI